MNLFIQNEITYDICFLVSENVLESDILGV